MFRQALLKRRDPQRNSGSQLRGLRNIANPRSQPKPSGIMTIIWVALSTFVSIVVGVAANLLTPTVSRAIGSISPAFRRRSLIKRIRRYRYLSKFYRSGTLPYVCLGRCMVALSLYLWATVIITFIIYAFVTGMIPGFVQKKIFGSRDSEYDSFGNIISSFSLNLVFVIAMGYMLAFPYVKAMRAINFAIWRHRIFTEITRQCFDLRKIRLKNHTSTR